MIREIERRADDAYPRDRAARFRERNRLRAAAGLPPERRERGGLAGVYDRNKHIVAPVAALVAGATAPVLMAGLRATGLVPSAPTPTATLLPRSVNLIAGDSMSPNYGGQSFLPAAGAAILGSGLRTTARNAVGAAANTILDGLMTRFLPPPPPGFGPQGGIPTPKEGVVGRTISRILPGGMTGREWMPVNDMRDRVGRPLAVYPAERTSVVGPAGYVMVTMNGERIAMLKSFAIRAGLYKAPPKPPVSGWDVRAISRAAAATKRVKKLAGKVGLRTERKGATKIVRMFAGKKK